MEKILRSRELGLKSVTPGTFWLLPNPENGPVWPEPCRSEKSLAISVMYEINMRDFGTCDLGNTSYNWNWIACWLLSIINLLIFFWLLFQIPEMENRVERDEMGHQGVL